MNPEYEFTLRMKKWLEKPEHTEQEIIDGATMLLQLNRNRAMHDIILRRPLKHEAKVVYELNKFLPIRLARMTMADVVKMEDEVLPEIKAAIGAEPEEADANTALPGHNGKREDHDTLPTEIQAIWAQNALRWKKIKELYNTCLSLSQPCDRFEYVVSLKEAWYKYKADFTVYDDFVIPTNAGENTDDGATVDTKGEGKSEELDPAELAKKLSSAQKYISGQASKLVELHAVAMSDEASEKDVEAYNTLRIKIEERLSLLAANNVPLSDGMKAKLSFLNA